MQLHRKILELLHQVLKKNMLNRQHQMQIVIVPLLIILKDLIHIPNKTHKLIYIKLNNQLLKYKRKIMN